MPSPFFEKFRRVTASTTYLPEIDGLRFLAVFWVAIVMHTSNYLNVKFFNGQLVEAGYWRWLMMEGTHGMYLFFMISGFILSLPFANAYIKGGQPVLLKRYYLRRLTRLEPPYIIALLLFFIAHVFVIKEYSIDILMPRLLASLIYSHELIYHKHSLILPVAWSLEIEVQFYVLAPLFCLLFKLKKAWVRRALLLLVIIGGVFYFSYANRHNHLLRFIHYFFAGLLLADLYVSKDKKVTDSSTGYGIGIIALVVLLGVASYYQFPGLLFKLIILFTLFYQVLFNTRVKAIFSGKWITLIGGMCYSIYLLHFGIIACLGVIMLSITNVFSLNYAFFYLLLFTTVILLLSAGYFYFIEKPFMQINRKSLTK